MTLAIDLANQRIAGETRIQLAVLKETGILVQLRVHGISLLFKRTDWNELGIDQGTDIRGARLKPGTKAMFPKSLYAPLQSIEARLRQNLDRFSFGLEGFEPFRWIRADVYEQWKARHTQILAGYMVGEKQIIGFEDAKQAILSRYDEVRETNRVEFTQIAQRALRSLRANNTHAEMIEEIYTDSVVGRVLAQMPTYEELENGLRTAYYLRKIVDQEDIARREESALAIQLENMNTRYSLRAINVVNEEHLRLLREEVRVMASPFTQIMGQLSAQISNDVEEILAIIRQHGFLPGATAERARGLRELYNLMAIQSDEGLEAGLAQLEVALAQAPLRIAGSRHLLYDSAAVEAALTEIATVTRANLPAAQRPSAAATLDFD